MKEPYIDDEIYKRTLDELENDLSIDFKSVIAEVVKQSKERKKTAKEHGLRVLSLSVLKKPTETAQTEVDNHIPEIVVGKKKSSKASKEFRTTLLPLLQGCVNTCSKALSLWHKGT